MHESPEDDSRCHFTEGLAVCTWIQESLLDVLIAHCRPISLYEMDISVWHRAVEETGFRLVAGAGKPGVFKFRRSGSINGYPAHLTQHLEHWGIAHRLYEQGTDGIFFYDYVIPLFCAAGGGLPGTGGFRMPSLCQQGLCLPTSTTAGIGIPEQRRQS